MLNSYFKLDQHGTTVRTEILAGVTTFLTMAYIILVNPLILGDAGMDKGAVFAATCIAGAIGSALMGLYANYPIAQAPGMGLNAFFAFAGALLDGPGDDVVGHRLLAGGVDGHLQPRIHARVGNAHLGGDGDFAGELGCDLGPFVGRDRLVLL